MKLAKTTLFSVIITSIKVGSGFLAGKVVAVLTGASGMALIGAFTNFISIALVFSNGAIANGVIKYTAEYVDDIISLKALLSTSFRVALYSSIIFSSLIIVFAPQVSYWLFDSIVYLNPIRALGISIVLYSINSILIAVLNGFGDVKSYTIVNVIGSLVGLMLTLVMVFNFKLIGALYALVLAQSVAFFSTVFFIYKKKWFSVSYLFSGFDTQVARKLSKYSFMAIVTTLTVPVGQIVLRNIVISKIGLDSAGIWQGLMKISDGYLLLITTSLATYYLPKLSSIKNPKLLIDEIFNGYKFFLPIVFLSCLVIYILRYFIIEVLYTPSFNIMEDLFLWQLLGDFFKIAAWILAYLMVAKAMTKMYVITEIIFSILLVVISYYFVVEMGLKGVVLGFFVTYFLYFVVMLVLFRRLILLKFRKIGKH